MSLKMNKTMTSTPTTNFPLGKKISAAALTPTVPITVIMSGVSPSLSRPDATGSSTLARPERIFV